VLMKANANALLMFLFIPSLTLMWLAVS